MKITIRDLLLLMVIVGLSCAWFVDRRALLARCSEAFEDATVWRVRADDLKSCWERLGGTVKWIDENTSEIYDPDIDIDKDGQKVFRPYGSIEKEYEQK